jgi:hypothetical protein
LAFLTDTGELTPQPITIVAVDENGLWTTIAYWPRSEKIGIAMVNHLERKDPVRLINVIGTVCMENMKSLRTEEDEYYVKKTFFVETLSQLGVFKQIIPVRVDQSEEDAILARSLDDIRKTIVVSCQQ